MLLGMRDADYEPDQIAAYGATEQPAIAARMAPHLRMTVIGSGCALLAVIASAAAVALFPTFSADDPGVGWAITALAASLLMLAACVIQVFVWRRAMASWRGRRMQDLYGEARLSWIAHLASYAVALVGLVGCMAASADAGWSSNAAVLLGLALLLILAAQVLAGVQFLRPSGPPGTLPAHMRRLIERAQQREDRQTGT